MPTPDMSRLGRPLVFITMAAMVLATACDNPAQLPLSPNGGGVAVGAGKTNVGGESGGGGMGASDGGTPVPEVDPVFLGISANGIGQNGMPPTAADDLLAELTVYAAGVRSMSVDLPWDSVDAQSVASLKLRVDTFVDKGLTVVVNLLLVDGASPHQPMGVGTWDAATSVTALEQSLDLLVAELGASMQTIVLGRRVDAYLAANPAEVDALTTLLQAGIDHLSTTSSLRAVGLGFAGETPTPTYSALLALGDIAVISYLPGLGLAEFPVDTSAANDLDIMMALAAGRPIYLLPVGYPSDPAVSSSADLQVGQLDAFFAALDPRRASFPLVVVHQLHDLDQASCDALLAAQGIMSGDPFGSYLCSTGLRGADDAPKLSWPRFLQGSAHFARP
jgi:hypothetical protein